MFERGAFHRRIIIYKSRKRNQQPIDSSQVNDTEDILKSKWLFNRTIACI